MANQKIKKIIKELQGASKMHLKQSKQLAKHVDSKESPAKHQIAHKHSDGSKHGYVEPPVKAKKPSPFKQRSPLKQSEVTLGSMPTQRLTSKHGEVILGSMPTQRLTSKHGEMVTSKLKKKSTTRRRKKTDLIRPVNKIKSSGKVDIGPKLDTCWDGYHAEGKKKSPSNKKTSGGTIKMVNNCVKN